MTTAVHSDESMESTRGNVPWWQRAIVYQIYPISFQDSNGDGIGDLPGIVQRLDYLEDLGVDVLWLSPFYPSPMADFGYDVTDYCAVHPMFGTMGDFDRLLGESHRRGLRLLVDLVPNHTSEEHPWFLESRSSRDNPRRDWYVWRDPAPDGGPPNNWISVFGGSAWTLDQTTGQYYLHHFLKEQPDLNYRNPEVMDALLGIMRFWLDKGVDGFRVDVVHKLVEDGQFRDEPENPEWDGVDPYFSLNHTRTVDQPGNHEVLRKMRSLLDEYGDRAMIGEAYLPIDRLVTYYGADLDECHLPFNFQLIFVPWAAQVVRNTVEAFEAALPERAWPNWVLGNHDRSRVASRAGSDLVRLANVLLLTLRGTPTTYYGEEIGMADVPIPLKLARDPHALNKPDIAHIVGRDPSRTPMQWTGEANAGFAGEGVTPWLPLAPDYRQTNVADQERDPASLLNLYRALARLRKREPSLHSGNYRSVDTGTAEVYAYEREAPGSDRFVIVLNFDDGAHDLDLGFLGQPASVEIDTGLERRGLVDLAKLTVWPHEGLVIRLSSQECDRAAQYHSVSSGTDDAAWRA